MLYDGVVFFCCVVLDVVVYFVVVFLVLVLTMIFEINVTYDTMIVCFMFIILIFDGYEITPYSINMISLNRSSEDGCAYNYKKMEMNWQNAQFEPCMLRARKII